MKNENSTITYEMVPVSNLKSDTYQRVINWPFVDVTAKEFDMCQAGLIQVSLRGGEYHVIDGQHRVLAARKAKILMLMCQVIHGLTYEEEAELFLAQAKRKGLLVFDYFNAEVEAKRADALEIKRAVEESGLTVGRGTGHNKIQALGTLKAIYLKHGYNHLLSSLILTRTTWDGIPESMVKEIILGVSDFIDTYGKEFDQKFFKKQLKRISPVKILREAKAKSDDSGDSKRASVQKIIFKYYNYGLSVNKLESKFTA